MDSMVPTLSPSASTMVAPCQLRTVSMSGMVHPLLGVCCGSSCWWGGGGAAGGARLYAGRSPGPILSAAAPTGPAGTELLGGAWVDEGAAALGLIAPGARVAVGRGGLGGRDPCPVAQLGATLLGPAGRLVPVPLHGADAPATDGHDHRADHRSQDRVPQAGHDPRGDLQLVQGREGP